MQFFSISITTSTNIHIEGCRQYARSHDYSCTHSFRCSPSIHPSIRLTRLHFLLPQNKSIRVPLERIRKSFPNRMTKHHSIDDRLWVRPNEDDAAFIFAVGSPSLA